MRPLTVLVVVFALVSCEPPPPAACTTEARAGLNVTVVDANDDPICDAAVLARDGDFEEQLEATPDCAYSGVFERAGAYVIRVESTGLTPVEREVTVEEDECHVITEDVEIVLDVACPDEPNPGLEVIVRNPDNEPVCNVEVTAVDDDYREVLQRLQLGPSNCRFVGAFERPATYALEVLANAPFSNQVTEAVHVVDEDACGVVQLDVGLVLEREDEPCPPFVAEMFNLTLREEGTGDEICDAQVVARDGAASFTLLPSGCVYRDLGENRPGTYDLEIVHNDYATLSVADVVVAPDATGCTVETVEETYTLTPAP